MFKLIVKIPIPNAIKDRIPIYIKRVFWKLSNPANKWELMSPDEMDENLLGTFIRHDGHTLDKISKTTWNSNKDAYNARYKSRLIKMINKWRQNGYELTDDIKWAEGVLKNYEKWGKEKGPVEPAVLGEISRDTNIFDIIRTRRSIRYFSSRDIEPEKLTQILDAGRWAPCSGNRQGWKFIIQKRGKGSFTAKSEMEFNKDKWRQGAAVIYVAIDERLYPEKYTAAMDSAASIQNMLLMAHYLGIGACWLYMAETVTNQDRLRKRLGIDGYYNIYSAILLGYPAEEPDAPGRKSIDKITKFIGFDSE